MEEVEITEEQRKRAEANRAAALAKRKAILSLNQETTQPLKLVKCRKLSLESAASFPVPDHLAVVNQVGPTEKFRARLEVCSPDSFSVTPVAVEGFNFPGEEYCFQQLRGFLSNVLFSHYTQNTGGGKACVYKLGDYQSVLRSLKNGNSIDCEEIPWATFNVIERLSHSFAAGKWLPCRPEHLPDEKVDELMAELPKSLLNALLPFQLDGVRFGLRRGGRCLIADEMGLGKTLQAISIAGCFIKEGSILVVCPAILRYSWAEELERWFPFCLPTDIHLVFGCKDDPARLPKRPRVVVTSYNMLRLLRRSMLEQEWVTLIVDESHHLHSTKQSSEKDELTTVLDMAMKVKHLILLSGTPSLSRPYDIFHQVDMLWPGLLGHTKYEFAKTYCSVKFVRGRQGKAFKDFSKGIRLEELNVLLKQSVMIRRLKEHVLPQLPPKRRQIINLVLKRSDITLAMETLGLEGGEASAVSDDETVHVSDEDKDNDMNKKLSKKLSALGIAKLPGFFEWLSIHPIMTEVDEEETREDSSSSHKMIIFGYHHKVLDGVQAFLCEKGIQFVRIDCNVIGSDRQSAVHRFQFSKEVKIALIGIRSGGSGLNLTAADTVVFLELPLRPADMQQAEDRAHRHGQKKLVNIYIFCAKDTVDESHWLRLNRSLLRVSSTLNGKRDALREIEVESVAYLETTGRPSEKSNQCLPEPTTCNNDPEAKFVIVQDSSSSRDLQLVDSCTELDVNVNGAGEHHESISSWRNKLQFEGKKTTSKNEESATRAESETDSCSHSMVESNDDTSQRMKVGTLVPHTTLIGDGTKTEVELGVSSSFQETLRFEVSRNTGRTHLYSCIPGTDLRPKPLFVNFRLEEVECLPLEGRSVKMTDNSVKDTRLYREAVMTFITEWKELRPIEKRKLIGKPLQLPLSFELCYLNESLNHDNRGLLNGGSKRRKTPKDEISCALPTNAAWKKVNLYGGRGEKEKLYTQGWSDMDEPLCKLCQSPCKQNNGKVPQFFEDLFCSLDCFEEYRSRTSNKFLRKELFKMERGICTNCGLDCHQLVEHLRPLSSELRQAYVKKKAPNIAERKKLLEKLVKDPSEGNAWHADHIIPVYKGGGECKLENMRTLCVACHADVTTRQCAERRNDRKKAKQQLKDIMNGLFNVNQSMSFHSVGQDPECQDDDNLLIDIPGSAYSVPNFIETMRRTEDIKSIQNGERSQELEHPTCDPQSACINSSNEASEVTAKAGKELQLLYSVKEFYDVTEALQVNENDKRDERNPSRQSMFSELKMLLGNDF